MNLTNVLTGIELFLPAVVCHSVDRNENITLTRLLPKVGITVPSGLFK